MKTFVNSIIVISALILTFSACNRAELPTVQTISATSVTEESATLNGQITSDGNGTISQVGFMFGTASDLSNARGIFALSTTTNFSVIADELVSGRTYFYQAFATNEAGSAYGEIKSFTASSNMSGGGGSGNVGGNTVSGNLDGHDYVDLGLPSGTLWATCNIGAATPTDYGDYFAWGETTPKDFYDWSNYRYAEGTSSDDPRLTKYCDSSKYGNSGYTDYVTTLRASDDAATVNWGSGWRMPTAGEINELMYYTEIDNLYNTSTDGGIRLVGRNGNSLFLPCAGARYGYNTVGGGSYCYYWTSVNYSRWAGLNSTTHTYPFKANCIEFDSHPSHSNISLEKYSRYEGFTIRPVCQSRNISGGMQGESAPPIIGTPSQTITDSRDGNTYSTVTIGNQTWMSENLRYEGNIPLGTSTNDSETEMRRYYPANNASNVSTYGYLYNWSAAMNGTNSSSYNPSGVQGICPNGWHMPSYAEWMELMLVLGGNSYAGSQLAGREDLWANGRLENSSFWGTTGFNAIPAGYYVGSGSFYNLTTACYFWTSTENPPNEVHYKAIIRDSESVNYSESLSICPKNNGLSVRCVKD